jgi:hypothetical protein
MQFSPCRSDLLIVAGRIGIRMLWVLQRMIDEDRIPKGPGGKRSPLGVSVQPNYQPRAQPVGLTVGS